MARYRVEINMTLKEVCYKGLWDLGKKVFEGVQMEAVVRNSAWHQHAGPLEDRRASVGSSKNTFSWFSSRLFLCFLNSHILQKCQTTFVWKTELLLALQVLHDAWKFDYSKRWNYLQVFPCMCVPNSLRPHGLYVAHWVPLSMGSPMQESWSGLPVPSPGDLPDPGIGPMSPALASQFFKTATWEAQRRCLTLRPNKMVWRRRAGREWAIAIVKVAQSCLTLCDPWTVTARHFGPWNFLGQNTGVDSLSLL